MWHFRSLWRTQPQKKFKWLSLGTQGTCGGRSHQHPGSRHRLPLVSFWPCKGIQTKYLTTDEFAHLVIDRLCVLVLPPVSVILGKYRQSQKLYQHLFGPGTNCHSVHLWNWSSGEWSSRSFPQSLFLQFCTHPISNSFKLRCSIRRSLVLQLACRPSVTGCQLVSGLLSLPSFHFIWFTEPVLLMPVAATCPSSRFPYVSTWHIFYFPLHLKAPIYPFLFIKDIICYLFLESLLISLLHTHPLSTG